MTDIEDGYCGCGCGELTTIHRKKPRKFISGHQARGSCNSRFGVVLSDEIKDKISKTRTETVKEKGCHWTGKKHKDSSKKKMSEIKKGIATTPRKGNSKKCLFCSKLFYASSSLGKTKNYCNKSCKDFHYSTRFSGENNPFYGKHHSEETKEKLRKSSSKFRSMIPVLPTKPERTIHNELIKLNVSYETEFLINDKFCVDVYCKDYNLIIYIDGCYWHACEKHCPKAKKPRSDAARIPYLTKCGYNVEIIWEHDINHNLEEVIKNICQKYNII